MLRRSWASETSKKWRIVYAIPRPWKWIPCQMRENFPILNLGAALERPTFLIKLQRFWVPQLCRAAILDCREIHRIVQVWQDTFLNYDLLKNDHPQHIFHNSNNLASILSGFWGLILSETDSKERYEKGNRWIRRFFHFTSKVEVACWIILVEHILTLVWWIIREFLLRNGILEISLTLWNFQSWKLNFRTEVCMQTAELQVTMLWIKEVEVAKSIDELVTSRSITGQHDFLFSIWLMRGLRQP